MVLLRCVASAMAGGDVQRLVVPLWRNGAPGFESRRKEPEQAKDHWVKNIHNPSITVYLPSRDHANGTAVVIAPGGGHRELVFDAEGRDPALLQNKLGVAAFALKYRLAGEPGSPYNIETHVRQDAYRAIRLARSRAKEWNIDCGSRRYARVLCRWRGRVSRSLREGGRRLPCG